MDLENDLKTITTQVNNIDIPASINFLQIPLELQVEILSYLTPAELSLAIAPVCKKFWLISKDSSLWKDLTLNVRSEQQCISCSEVLLRCLLLNKLKVRSAAPVGCIINTFSSLPLLKELDLKDTKGLDALAFYKISTNCPLIENLNLKNCSSGVELNGIQYIANLPNLQNLNLSNCWDVDDMCMTIIARKCQKLKLLNVSGVIITDMAIRDLSQHRSESLQHLYLDGTNLTDESMIYLNVCKNLNTLKVTFAKRFTERALNALSALPHLTSIGISGSRNLTPNALCRFFSNPSLKYLKDLELEHIRIDDACLQNLSHTSKDLQRLRLLSCKSFSDLGLKSVVENCKNLYHLDLFRSYHLTGKALELIPSKLPNLMELHLGFCINISHAIILDLVKKMPRLTVYAHFGHQVKITNNN